MGLLLLLTSTLLSSYFHQGRVANAQKPFIITSVTLSIEPNTDVSRDTNVTLRCKTAVSSSGPEALSREYTIYKDEQPIYTKTSSTSEDLLYFLPEARVSNTGKYKCSINIAGTAETSKIQKLTVKGLSKPALRLNKYLVSEGEELTAWCTAPGETGLIVFYFYEGTKEILEKKVNSNRAEAKLRLSGTGIQEIHCAYMVWPEFFKSEDSDTNTVSVEKLSVTPVMEISPQNKIFEGDQLNILCTISNFLNSNTSHLYLTRGDRLLDRGTTRINHSLVAQTKDPGEFECRLVIEHIKLQKVVNKTVSVTELFSTPTLTVAPTEVFQNERMTLTCLSERVSERLRREELTYTLDPPDSPLSHDRPGIFFRNALQNDFNYTCAAHAKGITKHSETLTVRPIVAVSAPRILMVGRAILGQSFKIICQSDTGTLPINYTLLKDSKPLRTTSIKLPFEQALFTVTTTRPDEISKYMCEAKNNQRETSHSKVLNVTVIVPLTHPILTVIPTVPDISEGAHLYLICGTNGTPPITFKWYREGNEQPLHTITSNMNNTNYQIPYLSREHSGRYNCEVVNHANIIVHSDWVSIKVHLALWKKMLIGGSCLLAVSVLVMVCVLYFKSKRGEREAAAELSVKPSSPKSDDSLTVNLTHDTEVYNTATVRVDRATVSVWSKRPPEAANDGESSVVSSESDVEYTEVVHPRPVDPARVPLRKGTDTVYSELQNSPRGAADHHDYGSVEYAELNGEQPEINHYHPEVNNYQDLPVPVD